MNRRNEILVVALVVQVILILLLTTLRAPAVSSGGRPLFSNVKAADIVQLSIQEKGGKRMELAKKDSNWVLPSSDDFPADVTKVMPFLDKLLQVQSDRLIARGASSYARLQVADEDYARRVEFKLSSGAVHTLLVGSSPAGGAVHVRADGAAEVYLTDSLSSADASVDAANWIDPTYFSADQANVNKVAITNSNGTFEFEKDVANVWTMKGLAQGETFDAARLTDLLPRLASLAMTRPLGKTLQPEYGLQPPSATVTLTVQQASASAKPLVLRIGARETADNTYAVGSSQSPYYARVASYTLDDFVTRARRDFLTPPPTAALPEPSATPVK